MLPDTMVQQLHATLQFSNAFYENDDPIPIFSRNRGVRGFLRVQGDSCFRFDLIKLVLEGTLTNAMTNYAFGSQLPVDLAVRENILRITDVLDFGSGTPDTFSGDSWIFPVNFQFRDVLGRNASQDSGLQPLHDSLPSSIAVTSYRSMDYDKTCPTGGSHIRYVVKAWILSGQFTHGTVAREIQIYDCMDSPPPPVCLEDFPGEYLCRQEKSLVKYLPFARSRISISISEPRPVEVRQDEGNTVAGFFMQIVQQNRQGKAPVPPPPLHLRITWVLKTHTFISVTKRHVVPTAQEALHSPFVREIIGVGRSWDRKFRLLCWQIHPTESTTWTQETTLWLPVSERSYPTPTFFTPYVTRRYSVSMHLDLFSKTYGKTSFDLSIPIQIVYVEPGGTETSTNQAVYHAPAYED